MGRDGCREDDPDAGRGDWLVPETERDDWLVPESGRTAGECAREAGCAEAGRAVLEELPPLSVRPVDEYKQPAETTQGRRANARCYSRIHRETKNETGRGVG